VNRLRLQAAKRKGGNAKEEEEEAKLDQDNDITSEFVDAAAPHPEFILAPPTARLSSKEYEGMYNTVYCDVFYRIVCVCV
jgi:ATP-dependent RNA helicase DDX60